LTSRERIWVEQAGTRIALARWGVASSDKPPALLVHGTGFVGEVWVEVASVLASRHTVYALDRRGHGASHKPATDRYHFLDFASDVKVVVKALGLSDIFGVGHSAGATDLLLAAKLLPGRFSRLFAIEPTIMDPRNERARVARLTDKAMSLVQGVLRRQVEFESAEVAFARFVPRLHLRTGPSAHCGPTSGTASTPCQTAGDACSAGRTSNPRCCCRFSKRSSRSMPATNAAIRLNG
jgi:pimeloyl-ACP methyl ester carboxylesterase